MKAKKVIAILTCYNRREKTIKCIEHYQAAIEEAGIQPALVLVDDGSTDGSSRVVSELFPWVEIIAGDGSLYWNGGMRAGFRAAMNHGYDYYLWLNDDTNLAANAMSRLLTVAEANHSCLIVGSVQDPDAKFHTYGGVRQVSRIRPLKFVEIEPDERDVIECDAFNGNCVLIPNNIARQIGNLSHEFTHAIGDFDYGLRAKKSGFKNIVAPGFYGECSRNNQPGCFDKQNNLLERLKELRSPKGLPPMEWLVFTRRHAPYIWPFYMLKLFIRLLFP